MYDNIALCLLDMSIGTTSLKVDVKIVFFCFFSLSNSMYFSCKCVPYCYKTLSVNISHIMQNFRFVILFWVTTRKCLQALILKTWVVVVEKEC